MNVAPTLRRRMGWPAVASLLAAVFLLRLAFGLTFEFWGEDERQIFLIGLQYYTTGVWPDFGPDVVYTQTRIPGGLQGALIAWPLDLVAQPEAPYVLLNLLSMAALLLLGWYIGRRLPSLPRWVLWPWLFFSPWTLGVSTHIYNPSYVLFGAVLFFVGVFEIVPALRVGALRRGTAYFSAGFGLLWIAQLHLSAALLAVVALVAVAADIRANGTAALRGGAWMALGACLAGLTLVPTILHIGIPGVLRGPGANVTFTPWNLLRLPQLSAQFFSLACFEIARFVSSAASDRVAFLERFPWAAPFAIVAALLGVAQTVVLVVALFWRRGSADWRRVRTATAVLLLLLYVSFVWSVREPTSHTFYAMLPAVSIYAFSCWDRLLHRRAVQIAACVLLVAGGITESALAIRNYRERSMYTNRALVVRAIREKNYHLLGERRDTAGWPGRP